MLSPPRQALIVVVGQGSVLEFYSRYVRVCTAPTCHHGQLLAGHRQQLFFLFVVVNLQTVTFLGVGTSAACLHTMNQLVLVARFHSSASQPSSGSPPPSIEGYSESHAGDIRSRGTQVGNSKISSLSAAHLGLF